MFGQQNNKPTDDNQIPDHSIDGAINDSDQSATSSAFGHPGTPLDASQPVPASNNPPAEVIIPDSGVPSSPNPAASHHQSDDHSQAVTTTASEPANNANVPHELIDIKQKALNQLSPLVGHLDQSPEDKFRTTMMMIQASDDQSLVQSAYEAAQAIPDEKIRAQALLDIVNEINYFTQHQ